MSEQLYLCWRIGQYQLSKHVALSHTKTKQCKEYGSMGTKFAPLDFLSLNGSVGMGCQ